MELIESTSIDLIALWAYTILIAVYSFSSFLKIKNSISIVENVGKLKGCPSNGVTF
jgi:hypothetical protein